MKPIFTFCFCCWLSTSAHAALTYQLIFDQANYNAAPGAMVNVNVLLRETATGGDIARLASGNLDGLLTAGFRLDYSMSTTGMGSTIPDSANPSPQITINTSAFDDTGSNSRSDSGFIASVFAAGTNIGEGITATAVGNNYDVLIATLQFTKSLNPNDVTTLQLLDLAASADTVFLDVFSPDDVNQLAFSTATIGVSAVPEPGSFALLGIAASLVLSRKYRQLAVR